MKFFTLDSGQWCFVILLLMHAFSVKPLPHLPRTLKFEDYTCSWKTVVGASFPTAPQSYVWHVIFDRAAGLRKTSLSGLLSEKKS